MGAGFVRSLLFEGRLYVGAAAAWELSDDGLDVLKAALAIEASHLPGPPLTASLEVLIPAVHVVYRFARRFLHPELTPVQTDQTLYMTHPPRSAAEHFSGDIVFRFLPALYQRALSRAADDELVKSLKQLLRVWPLSGVLADISEPPLTPLDFGGHAGVSFLFAERLAERERSAWFPTGPEGDYAEMVWHALGKPPRFEREIIS